MRPLASHSIATIVLLAALHAATHAARPGDLDPGFGGTGTVRVPVAEGAAHDLLVLPDGSVVVAGTGDPDGDGTTKFVLARLDATGGLVSGFGDGGLVTTRIPLAEAATARRLALDPDGRLVAAGISQTELATGETSRLMRMTRYFPDGGELDREFGTNGIRNSVVARDVAGIVVQADRSIVFVGRNDDLIGGLLSQGSGFLSFELAEPSDGTDVVSHQGGLVIGGTVGREFFLQRFADGLLEDPQFGDGGSVRTPIGGAADRLRKLLVLPDGKIVAVGSTRVALGDTDVALARYTAGGVLDPTFGIAGIVVTPLGPSTDEPLDAVLAPDGTMLVAGRTCSPAPCHGFLARLLPDGRLDPDFGDAGVFAAAGNITAVAMPDDGHVLVAEQVLGELVVSRLVVAECGNGTVEAGEACDDGNTAGGDCCSPTCTFEPDDSPCEDDGSACTVDACRAGACTHAVPAEAGCFAATASTLARVADDVAGDRLRWSWQSTTAVERALFGDPTAATDMTLCFVDRAGEAGRAALELTVPAAGICDGAPCWKATRRGFRFRDVAAGGDGVALLRLVSGAKGSRLDLKARNLSGLADLAVPLRVRLVRHDAPVCFEADLAPARGTTLQSE